MDESHYRLLKLLEVQPHLSQRELARELGVSLGKINYCLAALIEKGWIKARNFRNNRDQLS
ncbi:MAG: winged helix-turn-helix transcriptional regulator, partial [Burkholderiales bacterium]|nr:winged helix-turn-helix transcriptional regulator [Burkholderiales bacterium]